MTLHGAGTYYFSVHGAKDQPIFHSVFEFEYGVQILGHIKQTRLLAYVLDEHQMQFVLQSERDWTEVMDDVQIAFDDMHERCWHKRKQTLSDQGIVMLIDERAYLSDLVIQLHRWPETTRKVADASLYPWSSDQGYRALTPPKWLHVEPMLNLLCNTRHNRAQRYETVMQQSQQQVQAQNQVVDLQHGSHPTYQALARDGFINQHLKKQALKQAARSDEDLRHMYDDACQLVAERFNITVEQLIDSRQRRQFNRLMPIVVWLLQERGAYLDNITKLVGEDEDRLKLWLRNLPADHSEALLNKLAALWSPNSLSALGIGNEPDTVQETATQPAAVDPEPVEAESVDNTVISESSSQA
ncbi:hypothetical protein [Bacterioplanoides sp.]|uniref:hypothetical protein n=1 Tax=Bacterioplanoides sp. TaxID=2066072 RepID=UPI003B00172D